MKEKIFTRKILFSYVLFCLNAMCFLHFRFSFLSYFNSVFPHLLCSKGSIIVAFDSTWFESAGLPFDDRTVIKTLKTDIQKALRSKLKNVTQVAVYGKQLLFFNHDYLHWIWKSYFQFDERYHGEEHSDSRNACIIDFYSFVFF